MLMIRDPNNPRNVKEVVDNIVRQFGNYGIAVLSNSTTATTVVNPKVNPTSAVVLQPITSGAATIVSQTYVENVTTGSFDIVHPSGSSDRKLFYVIFGV